MQQSPPLEKWVSTTGLPLKREGGTRNIDDGKVSKGKYKGIKKKNELWVFLRIKYETKTMKQDGRKERR